MERKCLKEKSQNGYLKAEEKENLGEVLINELSLEKGETISLPDLQVRLTQFNERTSPHSPVKVSDQF